MNCSVAIAACAFFVALGVPQARAEERIRIDPDSSYGVITAEVQPSATATQLYQVFVNLKSATAEKSGRAKRTCLLSASKDGTKFVGCHLVPGRYVIGLIGGSFTFLCYEQQLEFDLRAGEAIYLGTIRGTELPDRQAMIERGLRGLGSSTITLVPMKGTAPLTPASEDVGWESRLAAWVVETQPRLKVDVRAAEVRAGVTGRCQTGSSEDRRIFVPNE